MVLLKLVRHLPDFAYDPSRSFRGWLRTLTAHSWSDFIRGSGPRRPRGGRSRSSPTCSIRCRRGSTSSVTWRRPTIRSCSNWRRRKSAERVEPHTWEAFRLTAIEGVAAAEVGGATGHRRGHGLPGAVRGADEAAGGPGRPGFRRRKRRDEHRLRLSRLRPSCSIPRGAPPGVDDEAIVAHVERCADCRAELERLAAATEPSALRVTRTARAGAPGLYRSCATSRSWTSGT